MGSKDGLHYTIDDIEVKMLLDGYLSLVHRPRRLIKYLERYVAAVSRKMFHGRRPDTTLVRGVKWPKLAKSTLASKLAARKRGEAIEAHRPLVRTGEMRDSIKVLSSSDRGFVFGTKVRSSEGAPYPGYHNAGGDPNPPQRRWLFLTGQDLRQMTKMTIDYLIGRLK